MEMDNERERKKQFKDIFHKRHQPLVFNEEKWDHSKNTFCRACHCPMYGQSYSCTDCDFHLHRRCAELPTEINLPHHLDHIHHLILRYNSDDLFCKLCQAKTYSRYYYRCSSCDFDIHLKCVWPSLVIEDKTRHEHSFNLFFRQNPFICDACGDEGNYASYICFICHIQVHLKCHSLPRIIKITRHSHPLFHNIVVQKKELHKQDCRICFEEVKTRHGSYYCFKDDCDYVVHVNCATEDNYELYSIIDSENQDKTGENSESLEPSITVIEKNEYEDATKIKHFSHQHYLILSDKVNEGEDQYCDGCLRSISSSFYYCSECDFFLHKSCAELQRKSNHWGHSQHLTLKSEGIFKCSICSRQCSGFSCNCEECGTSHCLRCDNISDTLEHPGHKHLLFITPKYEGQCTACGVEIEYAYRCSKKM